MPDLPVEELRCPTCGARQAWSDTCRRCKSDLRLLRAALQAYHDHHGDGLLALAEGRLDDALRHARRCHELRPGPDSRRLLTACHLARGDWSEAIELARGPARSEG